MNYSVISNKDFPRKPFRKLEGQGKKEMFAAITGHVDCFDYALPQEWLEKMAAVTGLPYHQILSTTVWTYPHGSIFGQPVSACREVQEALERHHFHTVP